MIIVYGLAIYGALDLLANVLAAARRIDRRSQGA